MFGISCFNISFSDELEFTTNNARIRCILLLMLIIFLLFFLHKPSRKVYLVDFACCRPSESKKCTKNSVIERARRYGGFSDETLEFMQKVLDQSGMSDSTYLPEALLKDDPDPTLEDARKEAEDVIFDSIDELLRKTGVKAEDIGILVVNCCIFVVVPSLSSMIVNRYKLREDVKSYDVSGMGCSAGLAVMGLVKHLLQVHPNCYALLVSTETITPNCYVGDNRSMLLINCMFRVGAAAILLSNRPSDRRSSKYQLIHTIHTHTASSDLSYNCVFLEEDSNGKVGVTLTKDLMIPAVKTIELNIAALGKLVLPVSEQLQYLANRILIKYLHVAKLKPYTPNFRSAFDHFFPHVGARPVLDEMEKNLGFSEAQMEASRMTLYRFGNTSSSSVWYALAYDEAKGRIKKGDRAWQIAFGSGFKCSSAIWRALRTVDAGEENPWKDEISDFPVDLHKLASFPSYFKPSK